VFGKETLAKTLPKLKQLFSICSLKLQLKAGIEYQVNHNHTDQKILSGNLELKKPFTNGLTFTPQLKVSLANPSNTFSYFIGFELSQSIGLASL